MSNVDELRREDVILAMAEAINMGPDEPECWREEAELALKVIEELGLCIMPKEATREIEGAMFSKKDSVKFSYAAAVRVFQSQLNGDTNG